MSSVVFDRVTHVYPGSQQPAVDGLDLQVDDGEFIVLVGPSGCGKSTSLRLLAGLEQITSGSVHIGDRDVTGIAPKHRDIAMVFQNYALYPHMSVGDNMGFALKIAGTPKAQIAEKVRDAAELLGLGDYLDRKPKALSGGQRQRVAMGRAIVREPQVFLMDEPLSNLDAKLRVQTRTQIAELQRRLATTTVYVTHDQTEALTMGDRVAVLDGGVLQQFDTPRKLYDQPANSFVAGFIGSPQMNLVEARLAPNGATVGNATLPLSQSQLDAAAAEGADTVLVGMRPEDLRLDPQTSGGIEAHVVVVEELGADAYVFARAGDETTGFDIVARIDPRHPPLKGETVHIHPDTDHIHTFSPTTGQRL